MTGIYSGEGMGRFTDAQVDEARNADLVSYLRMQGERLIPSGNEYRWVYRDTAGEHDSVTIRGHEWFDHKRQLGGDAIGFLQEYMGCDFREAVSELIIDNGELRMKSINNGLSLSIINSQLSINLSLPERNRSMRRMYAYLCKTRGIDHEVVTHFVREKKLYEDAVHHNAVFIATDDKNEPCGGMKKSTLSGSGFKQTISGSDTRYAFHHKGSSERVYAFEAAVDMLSFITMNKAEWQQHSYITLDGVSSKPLLHFLDTYTDVREVCLCLDNDSAGLNAALRIKAQLQEKGYMNISRLTPNGKDWNEDVIASAQTHSIDEPVMG